VDRAVESIGREAIDLGGSTLFDGLAELDRWTIPSIPEGIIDPQPILFTPTQWWVC